MLFTGFSLGPGIKFTTLAVSDMATSPRHTQLDSTLEMDEVPAKAKNKL